MSRSSALARGYQVSPALPWKARSPYCLLTGRLTCMPKESRVNSRSPVGRISDSRGENAGLPRTLHHRLIPIVQHHVAKPGVTAECLRDGNVYES